jgi:DNA-binding NarL/FixJ family response regulator
MSLEKPLKIISVEDDEFMRIFMKDVFWIHGQNISLSVFGTIKEAEDFLANPDNKPDLIFLDLCLPYKSGDKPDMENSFHFLEELKGDERTKDIKIIIFSSFGDRDIQQRALNMGANKYMVKGEYLPYELMNIVETIVQRNN